MGGSHDVLVITTLCYVKLEEWEPCQRRLNLGVQPVPLQAYGARVQPEIGPDQTLQPPTEKGDKGETDEKESK